MDNLNLPEAFRSLPWHLRIISNFLRIFFSLLYHQFAWTYDWVAATVSLGRWTGWVSAILPFLQGPRILELGHGPGHLQVELYHKQMTCFGLDRSPQMSRIASRRLKKKGLSRRLVNGVSQKLPFASGSFNEVVATFPSEYIAHPDTLAEIYRVLTPNGKAVVLPYAWLTGKSPLDRLFAWLFRITGEAPAWEERFLNQFFNQGFEIETHKVYYRSSTLLFVELSKSAHADSQVHQGT